MDWPKSTILHEKPHIETDEQPALSFNRRRFLKTGALITAGSAFPGLLSASEQSILKSGLETSDLIYLTPLKTNGNNSQCQAEVWFVSDSVNIFVVTATDTWRTQAVRQGLTKTRIWVGDLGNWQGTNGKYRKLPQLQAIASIVDDPNEHRRVLELFGSKYRLEWLVWGSRFRTGLNNGSRVMLQYAPV